MHGEPGGVRRRSARRRLRDVLSTALVGVVLAAGCRALRLAADDGAAPAAAPVATRTPQAPAVARVVATGTTRPPTGSKTAVDRRVFILSDSVVAGAAFAIPKVLDGWQVVIDGKPSRLIDAGVEVLRARRAELGGVVLVQLGNNYLGDAQAFGAALDQLYDLVGPDRWLILMRVYPIQSNRSEVNGAIDALASAHPNVRVADWPAVEDANPGSTYADRLHLNMRGAEVMARFVRDQVGAVAGQAPPR